jgi:hypothetical protein
MNRRGHYIESDYQYYYPAFGFIVRRVGNGKQFSPIDFRMIDEMYLTSA